MTETWKDIPGWEGFYQVSDQGRIRSLDRMVQGKWGLQRVRGQLMSTVIRNDGYITVHLRREGKRTNHLVHRFVLEAFVGPCPEGMEARHLNDVKTDARLENLEWGTRSENNFDRGRNKIDYYSKRAACKRGHDLVEDNLVPNQKTTRNGVKTCYACAKAHSTLKVKPNADLKPFFQEVADIHYQNLVGEKKRMYRADFLHLLK